jgi:putative ABC transport system permease protein
MADTPNRARQLDMLRAALPPGVVLRPAAARSRAATQMTASFYLSLRMLSLLALVVGVFIVYNTMTFAVVRRRRTIGTLRALGVTSREILGSVLCEGLLLSVLGAAAGIVLGLWLAEQLLQLVARTVNDLYFQTSVVRVLVSAEVLLRGVLCGTAGGLLAAAMPALEATRVAPRNALLAGVLERRLLRLTPWLAAAAVLLLLLSAASVWLARESLMAAFAALFALVLAGAALAPVAVVGISTLVTAALRGRGSVLVLMGVRGMVRGISRSAVAVAALAVALAAGAGMAIMVDSFRGSLASWLGTTLEADLYVGIAGRASAQRLPSELRAAVEALPGVRGVSVSTDRELTLADGPLWLKAVNTHGPRYRELALRDGTAAPWRALSRGEVLVSEPLVRRLDLSVGQALTLPADGGPVDVVVAGVFRDYGSDRGMVLMSQQSYRRWYADRGLTGIGVHVSDPTALDAIQRQVKLLLRGHDGVDVRSTRWIREASMTIFDRTFLITRVMQILATLVACVGMVSALMALALERRREFAMLRAQGATRGELMWSLQIHNALLGLAAGVLAVPLGVVMARVLVDVVNRRAFGWSMDFQLDPGVLLLTLLLAVAAAVAAGFYPGWSMCRREPAVALRQEA